MMIIMYDLAIDGGSIVVLVCSRFYYHLILC
jgi:hypothetical protein